MGKRTVLLFSVLVLLALAILVLFSGKGRKNIFADPYSSVTKDASFIIETVDLLSFFNSLTTGTGLFGEVSRIEEFSDFNTRLKYITDKVNEPEFRDFFSGGRALISIYSCNKGKVSILLSMNVPSGTRNRNIKQALLTSGINNIQEISKTKTLAVPFAGNSDTAFFTVKSGLMLVSNSGKLISDGLSAMETGLDIRSMPGFSKVLIASGNNEDKIFIVFKNLTGLLKPLFSPDDTGITDYITSLASAGTADLYINNDGVIMSGFTESIDHSDILYKYRNKKPVQSESFRVLPASTVLFETIIRSDDVPGINEDSAGSSVFRALNRYIGDEISRAYLDVKGNTMQMNRLVIYKLRNPVQAEQAVSGLIGQDSDIIWYQPDDQVKIPVYNIHKEIVTGLFASGLTHEFHDSLVSFYDKYMITGSSFKTISRFHYDNLLNNTLANDLSYSEFAGSLPSRTCYSFYCVPSRILDYLDDYLNPDFIRGLRINVVSLDKIQALGYQLASGNDMVYNSLSVKFKDEIRTESPVEWETFLDTTAGIKPFFFTNHLTGAREIFVQDIKNNIYLINAAGRVLWKLPLNERIAGTIYMTDYYRNGKYQLLFNTANYLHLIDRNGNYVERFPVKLRSRASNSLALFDYDNNRDYRILIAGEDRLIYAYDRSGNVVKGWKPFRSAGTVKKQLNYFKVSGKDYIAASDENSLYLLDRYGNRRVSFKDPVTRSEGSPVRLCTGSEPYLVCTSNEGMIEHIYFDGTVKKFEVGNFSAGHTAEFADIDDDGLDEYIFVDQGKLFLFDNNRTELFSKEFRSKSLIGPFIFSFESNDKRIGIFDTSNNLIYLLDKRGNVSKGFPLKGASMFSIGRLSEKSSWNLIVGGSDRFLYNYKIAEGI
ncbi:MAG TPA: hypothetical protein VHO46_15860 [Bacteroidales bacterium]|nr:hypothetical protein [Bacteroidales bacterium]